MVEHVRLLAIVSLMRSIVEFAAGIYLVQVAKSSTIGERFFDLKAVASDFDRQVLTIVGSVMLVFSVVRVVQSIASLLWKEWARKAGLLLGVFDVLLPITLPLALWSFVVYPHQETRDTFRRRSRRAAANT